MPKVTFVNEKKEIEVAQGANLREEARKAGIQLYWGPYRVLNCHGFGTCGTCTVLVKKGMENLNQKTLIERINLNVIHPIAHPIAGWMVIANSDEVRLACQVKVLGDCSVETRPKTDLSGETFWQKPYPNK
jgi:ferredoxin